jgi:hypothetical protein
MKRLSASITTIQIPVQEAQDATPNPPVVLGFVEPWLEIFGG